MAVYSSSGTSAQAVFHIYDPNGRKIGEYTYTATVPWSRAQFQPGLSKDIWYLGSKRVDMSEDQVGSNWDQTQYYPWGQVQAGQQPSETQGFGTYVLDGGSGLYYADQRYYNQNWGRFLTADPSNNAISPGSPTTWNRYAYGNGDPINLSDPSGLDATCGPGMTWDGEGCMIGSSGSNSGPAPVSLSGGVSASDIGQAEASYVAGTVVPGYLNSVVTDPTLTKYVSAGPNASVIISYGNFSSAAVAVMSALQVLFPGSGPLQIPSTADYLQVTVTGGASLSGGISVTVDKFGDVFVAPAVSFGMSTPVSASIVYGTLGNPNVQQSDLVGWLNGFSWGGSAGFVVGVGFQSSIGNNGAWSDSGETGAYTPQVGLNAGWNFCVKGACPH